MPSGGAARALRGRSLPDARSSRAPRGAGRGRVLLATFCDFFTQLFVCPSARSSFLLRLPRSRAPRAAPLPAPPPALATAQRGGAGRGRRRGAGGDWRRLGGSARPLAMPMPARPCGRYSTGMARPGGMAGVPVGALLPLLVGVCGAVTGSRVYPANEGEARPPRGKVRCRRRSLRPTGRALPGASAGRGRTGARGGARVPRPPRLSPLSPLSPGPGPPPPPSRAALPGAAAGGCPGSGRGAGRGGSGSGSKTALGRRGPGSAPPSVRGAARSPSGAPLASPAARAAPASGPAPRRVTSLGAPLRAPRGAARDSRAERSPLRGVPECGRSVTRCFASPQ